jgi:hypothetical protein
MMLGDFLFETFCELVSHCQACCILNGVNLAPFDLN